MTPHMKLDEKAVEAAIATFNEVVNSPQMVPCEKCAGRGYHHGFGEDGASPDWCIDCGGNQYNVAPGEEARAMRAAITAYLSHAPQGGVRAEEVEAALKARSDLFPFTIDTILGESGVIYPSQRDVVMRAALEAAAKVRALTGSDTQ